MERGGFTSRAGYSVVFRVWEEGAKRRQAKQAQEAVEISRDCLL